MATPDKADKGEKPPRIVLTPEQLLELFWTVEGSAEHHLSYASEFYLAAHKGTGAVLRVIAHLNREIEEAQVRKAARQGRRRDWRDEYTAKPKKQVGE
jgi:hypothetical protein